MIFENICTEVALIWGDFLSVRFTDVSRESKFSPDTKGTMYMLYGNEFRHLQFYLQQACSWSCYLRLNSLLAVTWDNKTWEIYGRNIGILICWWKKKLNLPAPGKPCRTDILKYDKFPFENTKAKAPWHSKGPLQWASRKWVVHFP